ncbi:pth1 family peptidyl-trna hydrolase [Colletotrichum incanum]|uniref:peptidyl-tRNA hydrolase n=1 Tax=Colletotrichum incanum TaxID=1573173 RepID=A0A162ND91_COLIC|nr:pth1 family peptidyl-trna hydrolase [Colletotrichum incanum]OHW90088.1 PTH1 family peptidyl-tRNA hydrolase [Colletotrichum incanum]
MSAPRFLLISLGNPEPYYNTLHSAGHHALNHLQKLLGPSQPAFHRGRFGGSSCLASIGPKYAMIQSPAIMNVSGKWVAKAWKESLGARDPADLSLILVHDDLEEELGFVKTRKWKSSHRGHNGVKSVNACLRQSDYPGSEWARICIGIGRPEEREKATVSNYVLKPMSRHQWSALEANAGPRALECLLAWEEKLAAAAGK